MTRFSSPTIVIPRRSSIRGAVLLGFLVVFGRAWMADVKGLLSASRTARVEVYGVMSEFKTTRFASPKIRVVLSMIMSGGESGDAGLWGGRVEQSLIGEGGRFESLLLFSRDIADSEPEVGDWSQIASRILYMITNCACDGGVAVNEGFSEYLMGVE